MQTKQHLRGRRCGPAGFSLAELMVSVALLSVVILALYSVFDQTQKAFRSNLAQVDVNESARSAVDLIFRDLERATPARIQTDYNPSQKALDWNILKLTNASLAIRYRSVDTSNVPVLPELIAATTRLSPHLETPFCEIFYFSRLQIRQFQGEGLYVGGLDHPELPPDGPVGTLYRFNGFGTNSVLPSKFANRVAGQGHDIAVNFFEPGNEFAPRPYRAARASRIIEGVVLFRVTPCDAAGRPMVSDDYDRWYFNSVGTNASVHPLGLKFDNRAPETGKGYLSFEGLAFPSSLEVELGVLEPATYERYKSMTPNAAVANAFLLKNSSKVQIFRQRIPLRTAAREQ